MGICGVYRPCAQICEGIADCRSGGTSDHGMYPGRDSEGIPEKNRAEAKRMSIYEYDQEKHLRQEREASWEKEERWGKKREEKREEKKA